jgi:hypothetical protein
MWAKAVVGRGSPASETCETNPIWGDGRSRAGLARSSTACRGNPRSGRGQALRRAKTCETKPNLGELGYVGKGGRRVWLRLDMKRAKRTQFDGDRGEKAGFAPVRLRSGQALRGNDTGQQLPANSR